jgi:outer membrane protein assembly factor BamB
MAKRTNRVAWGLAVLVALVLVAWRLGQSGRTEPIARGAGPGVWPLFRGNAANTGKGGVVGPLAPRLKWSSTGFLNATGVTDIAPVLSADGTLFCVCVYAVYAVRPDGTIRWTYKFPGVDFGGLHSPAVGKGGVLFVPTERHYSDMRLPFDRRSNDPGLYALDPTGRLLWKYAEGEPTTSPLIDRQGLIYLGTPNGVVALVQKGQVVRRWPVATETHGSIALKQTGQNTLVYYSVGRHLYVLKPDGGIRKATLPGQGGVVGLAISERHDAAYALASDRVLLRVDATNMRVKWRFPLDGEVGAHPAVADSAIYVGCRDTHPQSYSDKSPVKHCHSLYAINHRGRLLWKFTLPGGLDTAPAVDGRGDIYVTVESEMENASFLYCIKPDGSQRWRLALPEPYRILSSPIIGNNQTVYCYHNKAHAIDAAEQD